MADIVFRRTLHPVGHGAFFTEQLKKVNDKEKERPFLNVVYDCGASARGNNLPSLVKKEIDITFNEDNHIDVLFISHFDEDHTNGLEYLYEHTIMDEDTYVVIPFRFPYLIIIMDDRYPSLARFIERARQSGVRIIGIHGDSFEKNFENRPEKKNINNKVVLLDNNNMFTAWDVEKNQPLWYFYPFMNVDVNSLQSIFEMAINDNETLKKINFDDPNEVITNRKELKKIYQGIGKSKNSITKINVNSLLMLSFPAMIDYNNCFSKANCYDGHEVDYRTMPGGYVDLGVTCLYTGDSVLDTNSIDKINRHAVHIMSHLSGLNMIDLFQIPHHGSMHSFSPSVIVALVSKVLATFVNGNPYRKWYRGYIDLSRETMYHRLPLYIVSTYFQSRIDTIAFL